MKSSTQKNSVFIGSKEIGDGQPCFICFEAGPTHDGLDTACKLVKHAARAGGDAIKFQILDADRLVKNKEQLFTYSILRDQELELYEEVEEPLYDILRRRQLSDNEWREVKNLAEKLDLTFFATVGFEEDFALLNELDCKSVKIASADINHYPLLRLAAASGMNVQLDTGNSTISEMEAAVSVLESEGCDSIIIHQCPSGYPARLPSICLRMIKTLKSSFDYPIAYSDHTPDADMDIAAVALGVNLVEKTISLDRTTPSVEHCFSLEPADMEKFVKRIRDIETALGVENREISRDQVNARLAISRSVFVKEDKIKGAPLSDLKVEFSRPGYGISPPEWEQLLSENRALVDDVSSGEMLSLDKISESM